MMPRKLTPEGFARIRAVEDARRAIPTRQQVAAELGVSKSLVDKIAAGRDYKDVPGGTENQTTTMLHMNVAQAE